MNGKSVTDATLLSDFLEQLGVPHTRSYSDRQFKSMAFNSLFGLKNLLRQYGIDSEGVTLADKSEITKIATPFLARTGGGFIIVTGIDPQQRRISYLTAGVPESMDLDAFIKAWPGVAFLAFPTPQSSEPDYRLHRIGEIADKAKRVAMRVLAVVLLVILVVWSHTYASVGRLLVTVFDMVGLWLSFMLMQKSLHISNKAADRVCGILQAGGCDTVLEQKASTFFGIVSWSEVGLTYFSVSLLALLVFPQSLPWLAVCNICCLPFTVWSIWYQRFRIGAWCTMCVGVQSTLWLLFFSYLATGWWHSLDWSVWPQLAVLVICYALTLLTVNRVSTFIKKISNVETD